MNLEPHPCRVMLTSLCAFSEIKTASSVQIDVKLFYNKFVIA